MNRPNYDLPSQSKITPHSIVNSSCSEIPVYIAILCFIALLCVDTQENGKHTDAVKKVGK